MFKFILSLVYLPLLVSCMNEQSDASLAIGKIEKDHIKKQLESNGFRCSSTGGGGDGERFTHLSIGFDTRSELTISSARKYIVTNT